MKNEIVRCRCIDMSVDGHGIARSNDLVVFVKGMIKGEEADVKIIATILTKTNEATLRPSSYISIL